MPSAPVVTVVTKYLLLNQLISAADLFSVSDPDGDTITRYRFTDLSTDALSGYFQLDGNRRPQGTQSEITSGQLPSFEFVASSNIGNERIRIQAFDGSLWSNPVELQVIYVRENTTKPIVTASAVTMVESDYIQLNTFISATDPDGWPVTRFYLRDQDTTGGYLMRGNTVVPQGTYQYYTPAEFAELRYYAVTPKQVERIEVFAYDGVDWSDYTFAPVTTRENVSRPTTAFGSKNVPVRRLTTVSDIMGWFDSDGNQIKSVQVYEGDSSAISGNLVYKGANLAPNKWHTIAVEDLDSLYYRGAGERYDESIQYKVSDGKFWSPESSLQFTSLIKPIIDFDPMVVERDLKNINARTLFTKGDSGPSYTTYQIQDLNGSSTASARLYLDGRILNANMVHTLTSSEFNRLIVRTAQYQDRALDPIIIRANNGLFWSDWGRMELRTEPELEGMLRAPDFAPQPDRDGFNDWGDWLYEGELNPLPSKRITYSFMQFYPGYGGAPNSSADNFSRFSSAQRTAARQILDDVQTIFDVEFVEVPDSGTSYGGVGGVIRFGNWYEEPVEDQPPPPRSYSFSPDDPVAAPIGGDIWFNSFYISAATSWTIDSLYYYLTISQIGISLGLTGPDGSPRLPQATNTIENTVLGAGGAGRPGSFMLYDMYALNDMYGPNLETRAEDSTYDWGYFGEKTGILRTLWDGGGTDTLSAVGMSEASVIDLNPGSFSSLAGTTVRLCIPFNVEIENAIGTEFNDTISGNYTANRLEGGDGRDTITGKTGNDLLMGGAGNDLYIYRLGDGQDTINENASAGRDTLRIDSAGNLNNFTQDFSFRREGNDLIIDLTLDSSVESDGSIRIVNQKWGSWGVEILRYGPLGGTIQNIDLTNIYAQCTDVNQQFRVLNDTSKFGNLVAPV